MGAEPAGASSSAPGRGRRLLAPTAWAAGLVILVSGGLLAYEWNRRQGLYWYDVDRDYRYTFAGEEVRRLKVPVSADGFTLPSESAPWHTALLRLSVSSTLFGRWFEPSVRVTVGGGPTRTQFFERGARGARYVNVGADSRTTGGGVRVGLSGRHLRWRAQEADLLLFGGADPAAGPVLVLAPHPDDAEIAAFGLYAATESWVVAITTGSYPGEAYGALASDSAARERLQARLRVWDSLVIPRWGGVPPQRALNLGYFTNALERMRRDPQRLVPSPQTGASEIGALRELNATRLLATRPSVSTWENLVGDLAHLLEEAVPRVVVTPHPALDANRDHQLTTAALLEAMGRVETVPPTLLLYTNHHVWSEYFPFGPARTLVTLPPWFDPEAHFRAVYSHPLTPERTIEKLFALEAHHDLRPEPEPVLGGALRRMVERVVTAAAAVWRDPAREHSYLRRAVRPNELFFVYRPEDAPALKTMVQETAPAPSTEGGR